jgi:hypothetical protein
LGTAFLVTMSMGDCFLPGAPPLQALYWGLSFAQFSGPSFVPGT